MAVEHLKSTPITNLDAAPVVANTSGHGAGAKLAAVDGFATPSASASTGSTYQLVRIPSRAIVKHVLFESEAQGAGTIDLSVYYSDSTTDGTQTANQGVIVPTTGSQFFAAAINCASAVKFTDETNQAGNYNWSLRQKQLWDALGLTTDPGGFFDVVAVVGATAITTGTGRLGVEVQYVY